MWSKKHVQHDSLPFLPLALVFYEILTRALACAEIKILDKKMTFCIKPFCLANFNTTQEIKKEKQIIVTS